MLLALGLIIAGVAIVVGINLFNAYYDDQLDSLALQKLNELTADAVAYAKRPVSLGGGGGSFTGYTPASLSDFIVSVTASQSDVTINVESADLASDGTPAAVYGIASSEGLDETGVYDHKAKAWKKVKTKKDKSNNGNAYGHNK